MGAGRLKGGAGGSRRVPGARKGVLEGRDTWLGGQTGCWWGQRVSEGLKTSSWVRTHKKMTHLGPK